MVDVATLSLDCYRCRGRDCMFLNASGVYVCALCGHTFGGRRRRPTPPAAGDVCRRCHMVIEKSYYTGTLICACREGPK